MVENFKVNLMEGDTSKSIDDLLDIADKFGMRNYFASEKVDGVRMYITKDSVLGRSGKPSKSILVRKRFDHLRRIAEKYNIIIDGEFYSPVMKFNEIYRFYANEDVTSESYLKKLQKIQNTLTNPNDDSLKDVSIKGKTDEQLEELYSKGYVNSFDLEFEKNPRTIEWLTTFHDSLKIFVFDCYFVDFPDLTFDRRLEKLTTILRNEQPDFVHLINFVDLASGISKPREFVQNLLDYIISKEGEGVVLSNKGRIYDFKRSKLKYGQYIKLKDNDNTYDGVILEVIEGTQAKEGARRIVDGKEQASNLTADREPSGLAKGFLVDYEGSTFIVGLKGFTNEQKAELIQNKDSYVGRNFMYKAMPPVKDVPRHAFFREWRDEK